MGAITWEIEVASSIPPNKMYTASCLDADHLVPRIFPYAVKSVEILQGDGGVGTIKLVTFDEGREWLTAKHRVDRIDKENLSYSYSIFGGDILMGMFESISCHIKIEPSSRNDGGSICKQTNTYTTTTTTTTEADAHISQERYIEMAKSKAQGMFKGIEAYLLANPAYN